MFSVLFELLQAMYPKLFTLISDVCKFSRMLTLTTGLFIVLYTFYININIYIYIYIYIINTICI